MNKSKKARIIKPVKQSKEWYLYQHIGRFASDLDKLPDAAEEKKAKPKSVPVMMLEMVF